MQKGSKKHSLRAVGRTREQSQHLKLPRGVTQHLRFHCEASTDWASICNHISPRKTRGETRTLRKQRLQQSGQTAPNTLLLSGFLLLKSTFCVLNTLWQFSRATLSCSLLDSIHLFSLSLFCFYFHLPFQKKTIDWNGISYQPPEA